MRCPTRIADGCALHRLPAAPICRLIPRKIRRGRHRPLNVVSCGRVRGGTRVFRPVRQPAPFEAGMQSIRHVRTPNPRMNASRIRAGSRSVVSIGLLVIDPAPDQPGPILPSATALPVRRRHPRGRGGRAIRAASRHQAVEPGATGAHVVGRQSAEGGPGGVAALPRVVILDEPTRGIDAQARQDVYRLIRDLTAQGRRRSGDPLLTRRGHRPQRSDPGDVPLAASRPCPSSPSLESRPGLGRRIRHGGEAA